MSKFVAKKVAIDRLVNKLYNQYKFTWDESPLNMTEILRIEGPFFTIELRTMDDAIILNLFLQLQKFNYSGVRAPRAADVPILRIKRLLGTTEAEVHATVDSLILEVNKFVFDIYGKFVEFMRIEVT